MNLGSLGFLTAITVERSFPELERTLAGDCEVSQRRMLQREAASARARSGVRVRGAERRGDHEVVDRAHDRSGSASSNTHFMCAYRADGLILATPTGSTAYSLAANGPIVFPTVEAVCITPICPHTLTNRPVLVPSDVVITVVNRAVDDSAFLTVDGQVGEPLHEGDRIECRSARTSFDLVRPPHKSFFDVLRQKLKWGER